MAGGIITSPSGEYKVGIGPDGELWFTSNLAGGPPYPPSHPELDPSYGGGGINYVGGFGFYRLSDNFDPIAVSTPRDSWGVSNNLGSAWADYTNVGSSGVSSVITLGANTAKYVTTCTNGLTVTHEYSFILPNVLAIKVTISSASGCSSLRYQRDVDWDIYPTDFHEITFGPVIPTQTPTIQDSSYYGFENPDPAIPYIFSAAAGGSFGPGDNGTGIKLSLGSLAAGGSVTFSYVYAISDGSQPATTLVSQLTALGATYVLCCENSSTNTLPPPTGPFVPGAVNSAAIGVGTQLKTSVFEISLFGVKRKYHPEDKEPCAELPEPEIVDCAV